MIPARRPARARDVTTAALFVTALAIPFAVTTRSESLARDERLENRRMATLPPPPRSVAEWGAYPNQFSTWFDDHVGLRHALLNLRSRLYVFGGRASPAKLVELGRDGWYYHTDGDRFDDWRGARPFSRADLATWRGALERRAEWLDARGIDYVFALCPNKEWVYPEHFPTGFERVGASRLEQLVGALADSSSVAFVDLRQALWDEKANDGDDDYVYHRLGTHWTDRGAWAGGRALIDALRARGRPIPRLEREPFVSRLDPDAAQDSMGDQLYLDDVLREPIHRLEPRGTRRATEVSFDASIGVGARHWTNVDRTLPRVVLVHDSFGPWLAPILAESCSELWTTASTPRCGTLVAEVRPDVVLQMYTERVLRRGEILTALNGDRIDTITTPLDATTIFDAGPGDLRARVVAVSGVTLEDDGERPRGDDPAPIAGLRVTTGAEPGTLAVKVPAVAPGRNAMLTLRMRATSVARVRVRGGAPGHERLLVSTLTSPRDREQVLALGRWSGADELRVEIDPDTSLVLERCAFHVR